MNDRQHFHTLISLNSRVDISSAKIFQQYYCFCLKIIKPFTINIHASTTCFQLDNKHRKKKEKKNMSDENASIYKLKAH